MPSQWVSIPCYIVRPAIIRIQDALGIKVKVTSVFLQTGLRIKHREESLSLSLCVPLFGHVRNADDDTNSSWAFGYIARAGMY